MPQNVNAGDTAAHRGRPRRGLRRALLVLATVVSVLIVALAANAVVLGHPTEGAKITGHWA
jgi:hypothetical protein